jgi:hypothetical protein
MNEMELTALIRSRLTAGLLPRPLNGETTLAGYGDGATCCDCCEQVIQPDDVRYEEKIAQANDPGSRFLIAHLRCYRLWRQLAEDRQPPGGT